MKTAKLLLIFNAMILILALSCIAFAEQKSITLPKGTNVEKIGQGHFKFKLPNKQIVEVKNFNPKTGTIGYVSIIDPQPPGKLVASGKQGNMITVRRLTRGEVKKFPPTYHVMIDDEPIWLPATITYQIVDETNPYPPGKR